MKKRLMSFLALVAVSAMIVGFGCTKSKPVDKETEGDEGVKTEEMAKEPQMEEDEKAKEPMKEMEDTEEEETDKM